MKKILLCHNTHIKLVPMLILVITYNLIKYITENIF